MQDEPASPEFPQRFPTRELLLAQALDACITAERRAPGSAQAIIDQQPVWLRDDLQSMMKLAGTLDSAANNASMSPEFRRAARERLMAHIGADIAPVPVPLLGARLSAVPFRAGRHGLRRHSRWTWRVSAGLLAAVMGVTATLTASASALPGDALYNLKQVQEELSVRLAPDDQARALALLGRADARLDETQRLLIQGRTTAALETTQRYGQNVERATTTYVITMNDPPEPGAAPLALETRLSQQQEQLQMILLSAPEPVRADLREALVTTERGRALVADPRPVERALGRASKDKSAVAAEAVPTTAAEDSPTVVPTRRPSVVPQPLASVVVARATDEPASDTLVAQDEGTNRNGDSGTGQPQNVLPSGPGAQPAPAKPAVADDQRGDDDGPSSPPAVARSDGNSNSARGGDGLSRNASTNTRTDSQSQNDRPIVAQQQSTRDNANSAESDTARAPGDDAPQPAAAAQARNEVAQPTVAQGRNTDDTQQSNVLQGRNTDDTQQSNVLQGRNTDDTQQSNVVQGRNNDDTQQPNVVQGRNNDDTQQPNVVQGRNNDETQQPNVVQGRNNDDGPQPNVARQPAVAQSTRDSSSANDTRSSGSDSSANNVNASNPTIANGDRGGTTARVTTSPQAASPGDKPTTSTRDTSDSRASAQNFGARQQPSPTPTPTTARRGSDSSDNSGRSTSVPARTGSDWHSASGDSPHPGD